MTKKQSVPKLTVKLTQDEITLILETLTIAKQDICSSQKEAIDSVQTKLIFTQFGFGNVVN